MIGTRKDGQSRAIRRLDSDGLGTVSRSHEKWRVPLRAIAATTVDAVLVPYRGIVLCVESGRAIIGWLLRLGSGRLRQGWETEHGATRVPFCGCPRSRCTIVLGGSGPRNWCRRRGVFVGRSPWVVL
jgi:hypothetical protein